jgi:hypothetical protein
LPTQVSNHIHNLPTMGGVKFKSTLLKMRASLDWLNQHTMQDGWYVNTKNIFIVIMSHS